MIYLDYIILFVRRQESTMNNIYIYIYKLVQKCRKIISYLGYRGLFNWIDDIQFLKLMYKCNTGNTLHFNNPRRFNEKIQWLKVYGHKDIYTIMADKILVKNYIEKLLGKEYVIDTICVWDKPEDIDFDKLPKQFVLKCNHNNGLGMYICMDKSIINKKEIIKELKVGMEQNFYLLGREKQYKNIDRKVFAEKYMVDESGYELKDYKVFIFNGKAKCIQVDYGRFSNHRRNYYDINWNYLPFSTECPTDKNHEIPKPKCLFQLIEFAEKISNSLDNPPFLRTDFYIINDNIYFGEITFHHGSGYLKFIPDEWDYILGDWINLKNK